MNISFDEALAILVEREGKDFYAIMASHLPRKATTSMPAMLGVTVVDGSYMLLYNPKILDEITPQDFLFGLHHEMVHIENKHLPRAIRYFQMEGKKVSLEGGEKMSSEDQTLMQYATDFATNGQIREMSGRVPYVAYAINRSAYGCLLPEQMKIKNMPAHDYESYHEVLKHMLKQGQVKLVQMPCGGGMRSPDGNDGAGNRDTKSWGGAHSAWNTFYKRDKDGNIQEEVKGNEFDPQNLTDMDATEVTELAASLDAEADAILQAAVDSAERRHGSIPQHIKSRLEAMGRSPAIPWQQVLANVIRTKITENRKRSIQRPNRHQVDPGLNLAGKVHTKTFKSVLNIDVSGSMRNDEVREAFAVAQDLLNREEDMSLVGIQADTAVCKVWDILPNETWVDRAGCGGTDFEPALLESAKHEPDLVLYYTDGYAALPRTEVLPSCPLVWLVSGSGTPDYAHLEQVGTVVQLKDIPG